MHNGSFLITVTAKDMSSVFGFRDGHAFVMNYFGEIVIQQWLRLSRQHPVISLDVYRMYPDHFTGIFEFNTNDRTG